MATKTAPSQAVYGHMRHCLPYRLPAYSPVAVGRLQRAGSPASEGGSHLSHVDAWVRRGERADMGGLARPFVRSGVGWRWQVVLVWEVVRSGGWLWVRARADGTAQQAPAVPSSVRRGQRLVRLVSGAVLAAVAARCPPPPQLPYRTRRRPFYCTDTRYPLSLSALQEAAAPAPAPAPDAVEPFSRKRKGGWGRSGGHGGVPRHSIHSSCGGGGAPTHPCGGAPKVPWKGP